jgi:hypothetical protein
MPISLLLKNRIRMVLLYALMLSFFIYLSGCKGDSPTGPDQALIDEERTLNSLKKMDDYPFYTMVYYGDYGFREYLNTGTMPPFFALSSSVRGKIACTCFAAMGSDSCRLFGRNFDETNHIALLLFSRPPDGYASVSMVNMDYLGYSANNTPDEENNREQLLMAPYFPLDGINEKGVAIGIMGVEKAEPPYTEGRVTLYTPFLIRLVLDYASNLEEAIDLMNDYNISFEYGNPAHLLIADSGGHSAIIEFLDNEIKIIYNNEPWQVSTNFNVYGTQAPDNVNCWRYKTAYNILNEKQGNIVDIEAMDILSRVAQGPPYYTMWSIVYNLRTLEMDLVLDRKYSEIFHFKLSDFVSQELSLINGYQTADKHEIKWSAE